MEMTSRIHCNTLALDLGTDADVQRVMRAFKRGIMHSVERLPGTQTGLLSC